MPTKQNNSLNNLDSITSTIVYELKKVGVYHYNKLTYLFEFLFIKNFGFRYTSELFIKLPHGPVIHNYKNQISELVKNGYLTVDLNKLMQERKLTDDYNIKINICHTDTTITHLISESVVYDFLRRVLDKYAYLNDDQLEEVIYKTSPVIKYMNSAYKPNTGGYVLDNNGIKMKDYLSNPKVKARKYAIKHFLKYPEINIVQHLNFHKELTYLEKLRPKWGTHLTPNK